VGLFNVDSQHQPAKNHQNDEQDFLTFPMTCGVGCVILFYRHAFAVNRIESERFVWGEIADHL
jgi:hypothetical protein